MMATAMAKGLVVAGVVKAGNITARCACDSYSLSLARSLARARALSLAVSRSLSLSSLILLYFLQTTTS